MDATPSSDDLLRCFEIEGTLAPRVSPHVVPRRGIRWVLKWFAAIAVLCFAVSTLLEFAYVMAAEHTLARAARAGALEATLPRASLPSIREAVERRLTAYPSLAAQLRLTVENNRRPVRRAFRAREDDLLSVTLAAPTHAMIPGWLRTLRFWDSERQIQVRVDRDLPGRFLTRGRESSNRVGIFGAMN